MLHLAQDNSRARFESARTELAKVMLRGAEARCADRKGYVSEEQAGMAGVVTINQAEATFMDLNVHAFDALTASMVDWSDLKYGQAAVFKTREEYPIAVYVGNLAGGPPSVVFATAQNGAQVQPFQYFSKKFLVPNLVNAQFNLEVFKEKDLALARVARDMRLAKQQYVINSALNQPLNTSVATAVTNYVALGAAAWNGRTPYVLDPGVQSGSVVTTNAINDSTEGGLTKNIFQSIVNYCRLAPDNLEGGALSPRAFFFSKVNTPWVSYWNQASIIAYTSGEGNQNAGNAIPPSKWEEAVQMGFEDGGAYMNWFDTKLFCQPTNILPAGYSILTTNKPWVLGWNQMDASVTDERDGDLGDRAFNNRYEARSIALAQPDPIAPNGAVIRYA